MCWVSMFFDERLLFQLYIIHIGNELEVWPVDGGMEADANMILRFFAQTIVYCDITVVVVVNLRPNIYTLEKS